LAIGDSSTTWRNIDATVGLQCGPNPSRGPSVWYSVIGTGGVLTLSACDFSRQLDSGFNLYYAGVPGSCDNMSCMGGRFSSGTSCAFNQESTKVSFNSNAGVVYYIEVVSYSPQQGFDQTQAGTSGFVRIQNA
jgi:hypothetical protein